MTNTNTCANPYHYLDKAKARLVYAVKWYLQNKAVSLAYVENAKRDWREAYVKCQEDTLANDFMKNANHMVSK